VLADLAARSPAPGGGGAAAWSCAIAAALVEMAATFASPDPPPPPPTEPHDHAIDPTGPVCCTPPGGGPPPPEGPQGGAAISARAAALRDRALSLAERDADAYPPVLDALRLPEDDPDRPEAVRGALSTAAAVPLQILESAAQVAELAAAASAATTRSLRGDAAAGAAIAVGACQAALALVEENLRGMPDDDRPARGRRALERAEAARDETLRLLE
jgi:formiminotetrahydrofolate cyclodeaminase